MARRALPLLYAAALLSGCAAPAYRVPQIAAQPPAAFKEAGPWTPAAPADAAPRGDWWTAFNDPLLDRLEVQLAEANPDFAQALARYDAARADLAGARADLFPQADVSAHATRSRASAGRPGGSGVAARSSDYVVEGAASYELDLWGRVRNAVAAGKAEAEASAADLASARLSLQAQLASSYFALRSLDAQARILDEATVSYDKAFQLTKARHDGGAVSGVDVAQADTQLNTTRAAGSDVAAQRALIEHAIASLVGTPASTFAIAPTGALPPVAATPVAAPSLLLQRRPDVAAAERRAFAANRRIGVARSAFFPSILLDASGGYENASSHHQLITAPNAFWSLGPGLALTLFDGGRRAAGVRGARAEFDEAAAAYRSVALAAFQQVEDDLALINHLAQEEAHERAAFDAARRTQDLALVQYKAGAATYLDVVTAQEAALTAERALVELQAKRLQAGVDLVRALGGGWRAGKIAFDAGPAATDVALQVPDTAAPPRQAFSAPDSGLSKQHW